MPDSGDLLLRPASELAGLVRAGEVTARELVEASLRRIDERNPQLGAFIEVFHDDALAAADTVAPGDTRPLAGVPVAIKNNRPVRGKLLTFGSSLFGDFRAQIEWIGVERLRAAGAIVVGATNLPEFGILPTTEPRRFGPTRNPWDMGRTVGGSSGGSAAAVAAGLVPLAHGNDGGGSIRIPAACCGLVGLKPARGRISAAPLAGYSFLAVDGVLARTTRDSALALDVLQGPALGDVAWATPPATPFVDQMGGEPRGLRIAVTTLPPLVETLIDPRVIDAVHAAAALLEDLGHHVIEVDPPWQMPGMLDRFKVLWAPMISTQTAFGALLAGREPGPDDIEPLSMALWEAGRAIDAVTYLGAEALLQGFGRTLVEWTAQYDAILCPSLAELPVALGTMDACDAGDPMATFARSAAFTPFTAMSNLTGSAAISVPLDHDAASGLPVAVQLIGQPEGEGALLALTAQMEAARPWAARHPTDLR
ncbi:unannotated protein [freshwater metagenome]|uniref:Unannotated protein n=1 Tax=freshwater metagenome TaxID=449393 RepID=A0A6J7H934_9ZZZZ|nr:amidase [Actinomycetota bacterium]